MAYQDWAPVVIVIAVALAVGIAVIVVGFIKRHKPEDNLTMALCIMLVFSPQSAHSLSRSYSNCKILLPDIDYRLYWTSSGNTLQLAMEARTQGWLAFGVSLSQTPGSLMDSGGVQPYGSDIAMGYVGSDCPTGCAFDYWTTLHEMPNKVRVGEIALKNNFFLFIIYDYLFIFVVDLLSLGRSSKRFIRCRRQELDAHDDRV